MLLKMKVMNSNVLLQGLSYMEEDGNRTRPTSFIHVSCSGTN